MPGLSSFHAAAGNLMVVALADVEGLQKVAYFTLKNLYQPGDTIHTIYVEDAAGTGAPVQTLVEGVSDQGMACCLQTCAVAAECKQCQTKVFAHENGTRTPSCNLISAAACTPNPCLASLPPCACTATPLHPYMHPCRLCIVTALHCTVLYLYYTVL